MDESINNDNEKNISELSTNSDKLTNNFTCSDKLNCYCVNCQIPYENWLAIGKYLYEQNLNNIDEHNYDTTNSNYDTTNSNYDTTNSNNDTNNTDNSDNSDNEENFVFKKVILFDKTIYLDDYIDNLEKTILSTFKYDLIYKNDEIMIYNINDTECHLTNLLIHINAYSTKIIKIELISESKSQFIKSPIYEKIILFNQQK